MRIPRATYRIQLNPSFGFAQAKKITAYLASLGISDVYASPIFKAKRGSLHGYDVVDPNQLNPELGAESDFGELCEEVRSHDMGWLQDIVPNHMAFDRENQMLMDVLENGEHSRYFHVFDVDWNHPYEGLRGRILAPFLGSFYGEALERGEIQLRYDHAGFTVRYYDLVLPVRIESYTRLLTYELDDLRRRLRGNHPDFINFQGILNVLKTLHAPRKEGEGHKQAKSIKKTLRELYNKSREIKRFVDQNMTVFNGEKGHPESFNLLDDILSSQLFRLSFWKVATEEINYKRFFNINELISLRIEDIDVYNHIHSLLFRLIDEGKVTGVRVDHVDGLYDPGEYLSRLREKVGDTPIFVEKILEVEEDLPSFWAVQGTTGYDFLNYLNGIFCKKENEKEFDRIYRAVTGFKTTYEDLVSDKKRLIIGKHMAGDIDNLAHLLKATSSADRHGSDFTSYGLRRALVEVMSYFSVYRTYTDRKTAHETDRLYTKQAVEKAIQNNPDLLKEIRFLERFLILDFGDYVSEEEKDRWVHFAMRFQQFTGPLMAKGFEDTMLYVYHRLLSLNEVGGNPKRFGISVDEFHRFIERRVRRWPHSLNATSTHDAKRGEDVRARINVLSEIPEEWRKAVRSWSRINRRKKRKIAGRLVPDSNDEYFLYQTLVGAFPFREVDYPRFRERMRTYIVKAVREAKVHTAWLEADTEYEGAFISFVEHILEPSGGNLFLDDFLPFQRRVSHYGILNSLAQALIKITSPGVPDFYQGTELWDLNLVDPDNRRPVDYKKRQGFLREIRKKTGFDTLGLIDELLQSAEDGRIKLFLTQRALMARRERSKIFQKGAYAPLEVGGEYKDHILAFARRAGEDWAVTIAPRLLTALVNEGEFPLGHRVWSDTHLSLPAKASQIWKNMLTNQSVTCQGKLFIGEALEHFPVALLIGEEKR